MGAQQNDVSGPVPVLQSMSEPIDHRWSTGGAKAEAVKLGQTLRCPLPPPPSPIMAFT